MGRPETPLDPQAGPLADFAADLRQLRINAGAVPYRRLARRTHFAASTLARATRLMGLTLAGVDALPTEDGFVILEVNPVPGLLDMLGEGARQETFAGMYDWVEKQAAAA